MIISPAAPGHVGGRARSCPTANSTQPQPRRYHGNQFITEKNMCDDVSVNKSLFGNERETPSIRSRAGPAGPAPGLGAAWVACLAGVQARRGAAWRWGVRPGHGGAAWPWGCGLAMGVRPGHGVLRHVGLARSAATRAPPVPHCPCVLAPDRPGRRQLRDGPSASRPHPCRTTAMPQRGGPDHGAVTSPWLRQMLPGDRRGPGRGRARGVRGEGGLRSAEWLMGRSVRLGL
jgi:hypothetical protein